MFVFESTCVFEWSAHISQVDQQSLSWQSLGTKGSWVLVHCYTLYLCCVPNPYIVLYREQSRELGEYFIPNFIIQYHYCGTIILFHTMQYYQCGVCCQLVECSRELTLLWAHTSFPPFWICVCIHVFALLVHACLRSLYAEAHDHARLRLHLYVCVCLSVWPSQGPSPTSPPSYSGSCMPPTAFCPPPLLTKTTQGISLSSNSFSHPYKYIKMCLFLLFIHIKMCFIGLGVPILSCCKNPRALSCRFEYLALNFGGKSQMLPISVITCPS